MLSKTDIAVIIDCRLMRGLSENDVSRLLNCVFLAASNYRQDEIILLCGGKPKGVGIVLKGSISVFNIDGEGNQNLIMQLGRGDLFAESIASGNGESPVLITANEDCRAAWLDIDRLMHPCESTHGFHIEVMRNLIGVLAAKNLTLRAKLDVALLRTTREKILFYLNRQCSGNKNVKFSIPFSQTMLADYLGVDRSAMCRELNALKKQGIIDYKRRSFILL